MFPTCYNGYIQNQEIVLGRVRFSTLREVFNPRPSLTVTTQRTRDLESPPGAYYGRAYNSGIIPFIVVLTGISEGNRIMERETTIMPGEIKDTPSVIGRVVRIELECNELICEGYVDLIQLPN